MKKYVIITADYNDGDYVSEKTEVTDEQIEKLKNIINKIERIKVYGGGYANCFEWKTGDQREKPLSQAHPELSLEEIELIESLRPSAEYGIHTIEEIEILEVVNEYKLL
jgi:hypothetical protein